MDIGRRPQARFYSSEDVYISNEEIKQKDLDHVINSIGKFGDDNRAGIEKTLHRISVIRNRQRIPIGITCRVGRAVFGSVHLIKDLIISGKSVLILGRPGVGKTTILRETARMLADEGNKRVVIVDTSNEIAGDGDIPHPAIGKARRLQVENSILQHKVMIEAVENHMPEVIVIDEMSTDKEALAARTIAERGVQLVATAHGNSLENLIANPTLCDLIGGTRSVTLGDIEARRRKSQKTVLEREHEPTFEIVVEIRKINYVAIHKNVSTNVDKILRSNDLTLEIRTLSSDGSFKSSQEKKYNKSFIEPIKSEINHFSKINTYNQNNSKTKKIFIFGLPKNIIYESAEILDSKVLFTNTPEEADIFVTTKQHYSRRPSAIRKAEKSGVPVHVIRRASRDQINQFIDRFSKDNQEA
tara:strand:+ start:947 stop:2188 length:1242 start_codon:yes stop_codon:yes gene_type:complete